MPSESLIYTDESMVTIAGDAVVTIDFDPKLWTCEAYGQDHSITMDLGPSWSEAVDGAAEITDIELGKAVIKANDTLTLELTAVTSCSAEVYPSITAYVVVQQAGVGTFSAEINLTANVASTVTISATGGKITGVE